MLVDRHGKGRVVTRGELVGRPEVVKDAPRSWRVDRIREGDVVLVRPDPLNALAAAETRVLAMRSGGEAQADEREEDD